MIPSYLLLEALDLLLVPFLFVGIPRLPEARLPATAGLLQCVPLNLKRMSLCT